MALRRGFKAEAERLAEHHRRELKLSAAEAIDPVKLAKKLGVKVLPADRLVARARLRELHEIQPGAFSACTFRRADAEIVIVYNPLNSPGRQRSDVAHELAHILLDHHLSKVERLGELAFYTCDSEQEEEAAWLSGCFLLPRSLVVRDLRRGLDVKTMAARYDVSERMVRFRVNASGASLQVRRERRTRATLGPT